MKLFNRLLGSKNVANNNSHTTQRDENDSTVSVIIDPSPDMRLHNWPSLTFDSMVPEFQVQLHRHQQCIGQYFMQGSTARHPQQTLVRLLLTNRQILFVPNIVSPFPKCSPQYQSVKSVKLGQIERIATSEPKKNKFSLTLGFVDSLELHLSTDSGAISNSLLEALRTFAIVSATNHLYAFQYRQKRPVTASQFTIWGIYDFEAEFIRQGIMKHCQDTWMLIQQNKAYRIIDNKAGSIASTYPPQIIIPAGISEAQLAKCCKFRSRERIPTLTYAFKTSEGVYSTLFRSSQNRMGVISSRSEEDEKLIAQICLSTNRLNDQHTSNNHKLNLCIYDARSFGAALGNTLAGKGYERAQYYNCDVKFLEIPNIHAVRQSFIKTFSFKVGDNDTLAGAFSMAAASSHWYEYIKLILSSASQVASDLTNGINVLVHCSDGWDRTTQLCCLAQMMLDPYFRTLCGFAVLIEKDWRSFGHKFRSRTGQHPGVQHAPDQKSQVFIQFLDCVQQMWQINPEMFQFSSQLLTFLASVVGSGEYGSFLANNFQEEVMLELPLRTISVWTQVLNSDKYINKRYASHHNVGVMLVRGTQIFHWVDYFVK